MKVPYMSKVLTFLRVPYIVCAVNVLEEKKDYAPRKNKKTLNSVNY